MVMEGMAQGVEDEVGVLRNKSNWLVELVRNLPSTCPVYVEIATQPIVAARHNPS